MSDIPADLHYLSTHEWVRDEQDGSYSVGITDHAQQLLGDMVFIELPDIGDEVAAGQPCAVAESVKAASDIYAPLSGEIVAINELLADAPELINHSPYEEGWLFRIRASDVNELKALLQAEDYLATLDE